LVCDNPVWEPEPYPDDPDIFGQIGCAERVIVEPAND